MKRLLFAFCVVSYAQNHIPMRAGNLDCMGFPSKTAIHIVCQDLGQKKVVKEYDLNVPDKINEPAVFSYTLDWVESVGRFGVMHRDGQRWTITKGAVDNHWDIVTSDGNHAHGVLP